MTLHVYEELEQGSDEWLAARCGVLTASVIGKLITPTLKVASNDVSRGVTATLAAERITGHVEPVFLSSDMYRGIEDEPIARDAYAEHTGQRVNELGFMIREDNGIRLGYSPDGLIDDDGLLEIKSRRQKAHLTTILTDQVPPYNMAQLMAGLFVTGRQWIDYVSFCGGMPLYIKRVHPDPAWFDVIASAAAKFEEDIAGITATYTTRVKGLPMTERRPDLDDIQIGA